MQDDLHRGLIAGVNPSYGTLLAYLWRAYQSLLTRIIVSPNSH